MAGWATWGSGWPSISAMSPVAKIRSWPATRRSGPTSMRPPRPCGRPQAAAAGRGHPGRPDGDVAGQLVPVRQDHLVLGDLGDLGVQVHVHATAAQLGQGVTLRAGVERRQQRRGHLDQPDVHVRRVHVGEGVSASARSSARRTGQLHAGRPAADHGEVDGLARAPDVEPFQPGHDVVPQRDRVAAGVQPEGVLGRAGHAVVRGRHPGAEHQVVVVEHGRRR